MQTNKNSFQKFTTFLDLCDLFLLSVHQNYVGIDPDKEPFLLSVVVTDANNHNMPQYRAILWTKTVCMKFIFVLRIIYYDLTVFNVVYFHQVR